MNNIWKSFRVFFCLLAFLFCFMSCFSALEWDDFDYSTVEMQNNNPPQAWKAVPTQVQLKWHDLEYYGLIHYGLNSYVNQEWGYGDLSPKLFNPSHLDTDQWARVCKQAGMKGIIFVAKHHDGFCLWQTKTTDYSLKASPWKEGKGDVVADLAASCKKYGLKLGIYISPWDRNNGEYARAGYVEDYHQQWEELLTLYGDQLFEVWFDGANGGDGWYGGADETRSISKGYYQFDRLFKRINELAPQAVIFGGDNKDSVRWGGNESGYVDKTNWSRFTRDTDEPVSDLTIFEKGMEDGKLWMPAESDVPVKHLWFYHENSRFKTPKEMLDNYYETVGRGSSLDYGIAVGPDGLIPEKDTALLLQMKAQLDNDFKNDLAKEASFSSLVQRGDKFSPQNCQNKSREQYWATPDGVSKAVLNIDFEKPVEINRLLLCEPIQLGQRIHFFELQAKGVGGMWYTVARETTIGAKRILRFNKIKTDALRIWFETKAPSLAISRVSLYKAIKINNFKLEKESPSDLTMLSLNASGFNVLDAQARLLKVSGERVKKMIDKKPGTFSLVKLNGNALVLDMGKEVELSAISYLPRQDRSPEGVVYQYQLSGSLDGKKWFLLKEGRFSNIKNNPVLQMIRFPSREMRFVKLLPMKNVDQSGLFSCAEFAIYQ